MNQILRDPKGKVICIDLDGTLCDGRFYAEEPEPRQEVIDLVKKLHNKGACIIIYTARQEHYYPHTKAWLVKHQVPFVAIAMRHKPNADLYIDDKAMNVEDFIMYSNSA